MPEKEADRPDLLHRSVGAYLGALPKSLRRRSERSYDLVTPLIGPMSHTFFHWFGDYLVRLEAVFEYAEVTGQLPTLLIPADPPEWMEESLQLAGYPADRIREWSGGTATVDRLVLPSSRRRHCQWRCANGFEHYAPSAMAWLRMQLGANAPSADRDWPSTIVISREDALSRRIINEPSVLDVLENRDPERFVLSELSLAEQIDLFRSAELVVAPHGAGLLNMVYADDISVVECFSQSHYNPLFYSIANGQGFKYARLECEDSGGDLIVDRKKLSAAVEAVME